MSSYEMVSVYFDNETLAIRTRKQWIEIIEYWIEHKSWMAGYVDQLIPEGVRLFAAKSFEYDLANKRFVYLGEVAVEEPEYVAC